MENDSRLQPIHYFFVRSQNPIALIRSRFERPVAVIEGAAEHNPVVPREHIAGGQIHIINLRLRYQNLQLAAHRPEFLIVE